MARTNAARARVVVSCAAGSRFDGIPTLAAAARVWNRVWAARWPGGARRTAVARLCRCAAVSRASFFLVPPSAAGVFWSAPRFGVWRPPSLLQIEGVGKATPDFRIPRA